MADDDNDGVFVYLGGEQEVPMHITHAIIDPSVNTVGMRAFADRRQLVSVIFHDGVEIVEDEAFQYCKSLRGIKLLGVREIGGCAFDDCVALSDVEFGDKLVLIGNGAFSGCSFRCVKIPSVRCVISYAFSYCEQLTEVEFGIDLERICSYSFYKCPRLQRIAIPLKDNLFPLDGFDLQYNQFDECRDLTVVDIVGAGEIHKTISSLLMDSWRDEMNQEFNRINRELPIASDYERTDAIQLWVSSVIDTLGRFKAEHNRLLKEHTTQLELAIWKAKIEEEEEECDDSTLQVQTKRAKIDVENSRKEKRITSGADIIIKNVLPFLKLA